MVAATQPSKDNTDATGIERTQKDDLGAVGKIRERSEIIDHLMRMQDRYASEGGNQFSAGITYYSVLSMIPLFMLVIAIAAAVLASRPDLFEQLREQVRTSVEGDLGNTINEILVTAVESRNTMFGVAGLTALWSGLGWMDNLRAGISAMWAMDPNEGTGNFLVMKLNDLLRLLGMLVALIVAFGVTALGSSGIIATVFEWMGIEGFPGMNWVLFIVGITVGLLANFLVMWWMVVALPRRKVPMKAGIKGAALGAVALELIKQLSTFIIGSATGNPAGAVFGPVIVLMIMMYLIWRVVLYVSAWTATTPTALAETKPQVPAPAVIRVRQQATTRPSAKTSLGIGAALGAASAGVIALLSRR
ncbi:MAG: YhjD/YihY/BrkB family envelope integrity protein [Corynebacterium sp.]|nr:YhjD/YihY/BrkB family envelope integrity protein [Corynebacterium sp.]